MTPPAQSSEGSPHTAFHRNADALAAGTADVRRSPHDNGVVGLLVVRPGPDERHELPSATFDPDCGVVGDTWSERPSTRGPDGGPNPEAQVTVMNTRAIALMAGARERWALAGDQVYVDLDLSVDNLPTGTHLHLGGAVLEVTAAPHTGCAKFAERFGVAALQLTATPEGRALRLRGINTRVVRSGEVSVGSAVSVVRPQSQA